MIAEASPWALFAFFVAGLITFVLWVLRLFSDGKIIQGRVFDAARTDRDTAFESATAAIEAGSGMMSAVGSLSTSLRDQGQVLERVVRTQADIATAIVDVRADLQRLDADIRKLVILWDQESSPGPRR